MCTWLLEKLFCFFYYHILNYACPFKFKHFSFGFMHPLGIVATHLLCKNDKFYYVKKINLHIYTHHIIVYILLIKKTYFAIGIFKINCLTCTLKCSNLYIKLFVNKYIDVVAWLLVYTCHYNNISCFNF